jgi:hypothetical protein
LLLIIWLEFEMGSITFKLNPLVVILIVNVQAIVRVIVSALFIRHAKILSSNRLSFKLLLRCWNLFIELKERLTSVHKEAIDYLGQPSVIHQA